MRSFATSLVRQLQKFEQWRPIGRAAICWNERNPAACRRLEVWCLAMGVWRYFCIIIRGGHLLSLHFGARVHIHDVSPWLLIAGMKCRCA
jgi:hypothetical protein